MRRASLAKQLVSTANGAERKKLIIDNIALADLQLAEEIKKICFAAWTHEPVTAQRAARALTSLRKFNGDPAIEAFAHWINGISEITTGRFENAVDSLDRSAAILSKIDRRRDAAQTQVSKLLALAMLGRYDDAIETGRAALRIFESYGDALAAGKIEMNLSNIVSRRGLEREAEKYCLSARRRFIKAGERSWQAMAENGLANTYTELNDFQRAERFYAKALKTAASAGMLVTEAEIEASMGNLALLRGRYGDALRFLELSRRKYETLDMPHQSAIADLEIAGIYSELNLISEALEIYERVCSSFRRLGLKAEEARARYNYGRDLAATGSAAKARRQFERALGLYRAEKNRSGQALAMLGQARIALDGGAYSLVTTLTSAIRELLPGRENIRMTPAVVLLDGEVFRRSAMFADAQSTFETVLRDARKLQQPDSVQRALHSLGKLAADGGDQMTAITYLKKAIREIERLRAPLASEEFSMAFLASRLEPYDDLARLYLDDGKVSRAFKTIESGRARALLDALVDDNRDNADNEFAVELVRLRAELNAYYKRFDRAKDGELSNLQAAIRQREAKIAQLSRQAASVSGSRSVTRGSSNHGVDLKQLQKQLGKAKVLLEYVVFDGRVSAFVIGGNAIRFVRDIAAVNEISADLDALHFQFGTMRYGAARMERFRSEMKSRTDRCLGRLYDRLVRPLEKYLAGDSLVFVPVGALNYVPFHALHDGERYLVERFETSSAPSSAVWGKLQEREVKTIRTSLLVGFADERIPLVENEIREIASLVPRAKVLTGEAATLAEFSKRAFGRDLIHLACHGQFRADNPMFSSLHLADGWITVRDICRQRLSAELVTLSACETGLNKVFAGEEILGLARGFLTAGAASLIVSLWAVNDAAAGEIMKDLYSHMQRGHSATTSLRYAQLRSVGRGEHPFLWAPFVMIGR